MATTRWRLAVAFCLAFHTTALADPSVVHDQRAVNDPAASNISVYLHAQDFQLTRPTTLTSISAWLAESRRDGTDDGVLDGFDGLLSWGLFSDAASRPGRLIVQGNDDHPVLTDVRGQFSFGGDIFRVDVAITSPLLEPGRYWIALHEGTWDVPNSTYIGWSNASNPRLGAGTYASDLRPLGRHWQGPFSEQASILYGVVIPEPASAALATTAALGLLVRRRFSPC